MQENTLTLLNVEELSKMTNLKVSKIRSLVFEKRIPYLKVRRSLRFNKQDIINWLETKKVEPKER